MVRAVPYRPAKGPEGDRFYGLLCAQCRRDSSEGHPCRLLIRGLLLKGRQLFPREWVQGADGPHCTAMVPINAQQAASVMPAPAQLNLWGEVS